MESEKKNKKNNTLKNLNDIQDSIFKRNKQGQKKYSLFLNNNSQKISDKKYSLQNPSQVQCDLQPIIDQYKFAEKQKQKQNLIYFPLKKNNQRERSKQKTTKNKTLNNQNLSINSHRTPRLKSSAIKKFKTKQRQSQEKNFSRKDSKSLTGLLGVKNELQQSQEKMNFLKYSNGPKSRSPSSNLTQQYSFLQYLDQKNSEESTLFSSTKRSSKNFMDQIQKNNNKLFQYNFTQVQGQKIQKNKKNQFFAANSIKGSAKNENQDRVSILVNHQIKMKLKEIDCNVFSVFDGHGGITACNYLQKNFNQILCDNLEKTNNIISAIEKTFNDIDSTLLSNMDDFSGSCATTLMQYQNTLLAINLGDSRIIGSYHNGKVVQQITTDHIPSDIKESHRIFKNGGYIYKENLKTKKIYEARTFDEISQVNKQIQQEDDSEYENWRVNPGTLTVARAFGDRLSKFKNDQKISCIVCDPEIAQIETRNLDFLLIVSDGITKIVDNNQLILSVYETIDHFKEQKKNFDEEVLMESVNNLIKTAIINRSTDDMTVILVCFRNLFN